MTKKLKPVVMWAREKCWKCSRMIRLRKDGTYSTHWHSSPPPSQAELNNGDWKWLNEVGKPCRASHQVA